MYRRFPDNIGTVVLKGNSICIAEVLYIENQMTYMKTYVKSYFSKLCHFALQKGSFAVTVKGSLCRIVHTDRLKNAFHFKD